MSTGGVVNKLCETAAYQNTKGVQQFLSQLPISTDVSTLCDHRGSTPLHYASLGGSKVCVQAILKHFGNKLLDVQDDGGRTPLLCATLWSKFKASSVLLNSNASTVLSDYNGHSLLTLLQGFGGAKMAPFLKDVKRRKALRDVFYVVAQNLLKHTMGNTRINMTCSLLPYIRDVFEQPDDLGQSLFHYAILYGHYEIVETCLKQGAMKHARNIPGNVPPIYLACKTGQTSLLSLLLPDNITDKELLKCIEIALCRGHLATAVKLLEIKPDVKLHTRSRTNLACCVDRYPKMAASLMKVIKDPILSTRHLSYAAWQGDESLLKTLLNHGAAYNTVDLLGRSALHEAAFRGAEEIIGHLLKCNDLDPNICDQRGETALHYACRAGNIGCASKLLEDERVDPTVEDCQGRTPLGVAVYRNKFNLIGALVERYPDRFVCTNRELSNLEKASILGIKQALWPSILNSNNTGNTRGYTRPEDQIPKQLTSDSVWSPWNINDWLETRCDPQRDLWYMGHQLREAARSFLKVKTLPSSDFEPHATKTETTRKEKNNSNPIHKHDLHLVKCKLCQEFFRYNK